MPRRVVITGCGVVSAAGCDLETFWAGLMTGTCFIRPLRNFTCAGVSPLLGGEVELPPADTTASESLSHIMRERCADLALAAARRAIDDARLDRDPAALERTGLVLGTTLGQERQVSDLSDRIVQQGADALDAGFLGRADNHELAARIARRHGLAGPVLLTATACSSGNSAVAWAYDLIGSGACNTMVAAGVDTFTRLIYCGFQRMGALSKGTCRPFDRNRDGVSFGEGAGVVVLEEEAHARARGARIYAELVGYGLSNDAYHITAPEPNGEGFVRAVQQALATTQTQPEQVDYVSAHGTGTAYNDIGEMRAMMTIFGERARTVPLSSIKSLIGHTNGAASLIETVACALSLVHQAIPPTANWVTPEPGFELDHVPGRGRPMKLNVCLNLAAGFGGANSCLVLRGIS